MDEMRTRSRPQTSRAPAGWIGDDDVSLSATQLAKLAGVQPNDLAYWGRAGFLDVKGEKRDENKEVDDEGRAFSLGQLPKAKLLGLFAKRLQIKASRASEIADELLEHYRTEPEKFAATVSMVQLLETKITAFIDLLVERDLVPLMEELMKEDP